MRNGLISNGTVLSHNDTTRGHSIQRTGPSNVPEPPDAAGFFEEILWDYPYRRRKDILPTVESGARQADHTVPKH
jgi:hypothetical protein